MSRSEQCHPFPCQPASEKLVLLYQRLYPQMKILFASLVLLVSGIFAVAQNEQAPIYLKEVEFKNWNYTDSRTGKSVNLRDYTKGKKLVAVVYYAPWCPNWRHDAPMVEKLYEKYKDKGFAVSA
jgi:thiol-disulfide isomerase/thioredoxin